MTHLVRPYPGFCNVKKVGAFPLPLDEMLVHRRPGYPVLIYPVLIYIPAGGERHCESKSVLPKNTHRTKFQESVNGNVDRRNLRNRSGNTTDNLCLAVSCRLLAVRCCVCTAEPDHFLFMFSSCFSQSKEKFLSQLKVAETHANVTEICLFHVSVDVFWSTECVMAPAETQETIRKVMSVSCFFCFLFFVF